MPRKPKTPHWSSKLSFPSLDGETAPAPQPMTITSAHRGYSTPAFAPPTATWHVVELLPDGGRAVHLVGGHPWAGSEVRARTEAGMLARTTGRRFEAVPAESAQPARRDADE
jgi:hypothetical protein